MLKFIVIMLLALSQTAFSADTVIVDGVMYSAQRPVQAQNVVPAGQTVKVGEKCTTTKSGMHQTKSCSWDKTVSSDVTGNSISVDAGGQSAVEILRPEMLLSAVSMASMVLAVAFMVVNLYEAAITITAVAAFAAFAVTAVTAVTAFAATTVAVAAALAAATTATTVAVAAAATPDRDKKVFYRAADIHLLLMAITIAIMW